jgi:streptogramin lyase
MRTSTLSRRLFAGSLLGASIAAAKVPIHKAKVTRVYKAPDGHPNALEATPEGLWVGDQCTDRAHLLDWKTGEVLKKVDTESSNTSGMAYGGGFLWMGANGGPLGRLARPDELKNGRIVKVDPDTGRTLGVFPVPDGGGVHGVLWADDSLWMTCFKWNVVARVDPETFKVIDKFPFHLSRPHGLAWAPPAMWVGYSNDWVFLKQDLKDGCLLEAVTLEKWVDPDPHGMDMYQAKMYYCDAGISPPGVPSGSKGAGYIYRIDW